MTDDEFLAALEGGRLPASSFNHSAHVRLGYVCLKRLGFPKAVASVSALIKNYANSRGLGALYHETVTIAFLALIHEHLSNRGDAGGWEAFLDQNPELLRKDALAAYYPKELLDSPVARARFVLMPLPGSTPTSQI